MQTAASEKVEGKERGSLRRNSLKTSAPTCSGEAGSVCDCYQSEQNLWRTGRMEVDDSLYQEEARVSSQNRLTTLITEEELEVSPSKTWFTEL